MFLSQTTLHLKPLRGKRKSINWNPFFTGFFFSHMSLSCEGTTLYALSLVPTKSLHETAALPLLFYFFPHKFIKQESLSFYGNLVCRQSRCTYQKLVKSSQVVCLSTRTSKDLPFLMLQGAMTPLQSSSCTTPSKLESFSLSHRKQAFLLQTQG